MSCPILLLVEGKSPWSARLDIFPYPSLILPNAASACLAPPPLLLLVLFIVFLVSAEVCFRVMVLEVVIFLFLCRLLRYLILSPAKNPYTCTTTLIIKTAHRSKHLRLLPKLAAPFSRK